MEFLNTNNAPVAIGPYSQAVRVNGLLYTSGQIALTLDGIMVENDVKKQTRQIFSNIQAILRDAGSSMDEVIKVNIFNIWLMGDLSLQAVFDSFFLTLHGRRMKVQLQPAQSRVSLTIFTCFNWEMHSNETSSGYWIRKK